MSSPVSDDILRAGSGAGRVRPPTIRIRSPRDSQWTGETTLPEAGVVSPARYIYAGAMGQSDVPSRLIVTLGAVLFARVMVGSVFAGISSSPIPFASPAASTATFAAPSAAAPSAPSVIPFGTNVGLVGTVAADQQAFAASGRNPALLHPPNLHQAPPLRSTGGVVTSLYSVGPAPMGVAYDGLKNTTGTMQATTVNTTSLAGTYSTGDPMGTQTEEFDVPTGPSAYQPSYDSYGAQLNAVLANVTIFGHTSFYNPKDPDAPHGCPDCAGNPSRGPAPCPNEFWMQNYIEYQSGTHELQLGDEVWNVSNPTASWGDPSSNSSADDQSVVGFGSVAYGIYFLSNTPSAYGPTINIAYPSTLVLYLNITRGPCHLDTVPGTGVPSCTAHGSTVSMTAPVNEIFFNYSIWKTPSQPGPSGDVCKGQARVSGRRAVSRNRMRRIRRPVLQLREPRRAHCRGSRPWPARSDRLGRNRSERERVRPRGRDERL
jgi:hypothetical protein